MNIITISREFGSGGRELGTALAEILGYDYYDREIITAVAERTGMDERYIERRADNNIFRAIPSPRPGVMSFSSTYSFTSKLLSEQHKVIREIGERGENCVIVGRCADVVLAEHDPLNIFVYADMKAKIRRCRSRADIESLSDKEIEKKIKNIDRSRIRIRELAGDGKWGKRESYHLMINTTGRGIPDIAPAVAAYIRAVFGEAI